MTQITGLSELLGLAGLDIDVVEQEADGSWTVARDHRRGSEPVLPRLRTAQ